MQDPHRSGKEKALFRILNGKKDVLYPEIKDMIELCIEEGFGIAKFKNEIIAFYGQQLELSL